LDWRHYQLAYVISAVISVVYEKHKMVNARHMDQLSSQPQRSLMPYSFRGSAFTSRTISITKPLNRSARWEAFLNMVFVVETWI